MGRRGPRGSVMYQIVDDHWIYLGKLGTRGQVHVSLGDKDVNLHRYLWAEWHAKAPDGTLERTCDQARCVYPPHYRESGLRGGSWEPDDSDVIIDDICLTIEPY